MPRLTKEEKEHYSVQPAANGNWRAFCPNWGPGLGGCDFYVTATDHSVTQVGVVNTVKYHEKFCEKRPNNG